MELLDIIEGSLRAKYSNAEITSMPLSDGGDGWLSSWEPLGSWKKVWVDVKDPLGKLIKAPYLFDVDSGIAVVEMAKASGLALLEKESYDVMKATTFGTGQLLKSAGLQGVRKIILGVGGSATCDGGLGMAAALGYSFLNREGKPIDALPTALPELQSIHAPEEDILQKVELVIASDVNNPLCGPAGASRVYGPQKGASPEQIEFLESGLNHFGRLLETFAGRPIREVPGSGAAGGIVAGLLALGRAQVVSGIDLLFETLGFSDQLPSADWMIFAEGKLDVQSLNGKVLSGLLKRKRPSTKLLVICGQSELSEEQQRRNGIDAVLQVIDRADNLEDSILRASHYVSSCVSAFSFVTS